MYACMYVRMYVCMYVCLFVCLCVRMYVCMYLCRLYVGMYVCTYVCMYVAICVILAMMYPPSPLPGQEADATSRTSRPSCQARPTGTTDSYTGILHIQMFNMESCHNMYILILVYLHILHVLRLLTSRVKPFCSPRAQLKAQPRCAWISMLILPPKQRRSTCLYGD